MRKTSKLFLLVAALGLLTGCTGGGNSNKGSSGGNSGTPSQDTENLINVIYFNTYVSEKRANEIKEGFIDELEKSGEDVDASKINFFQSRNSKVAGLGEEILDYNSENPKNTIDVLLGANNFNAWDDEELKPIFEAKYENDGLDYTYGTHSNLSNNTNRKFFYDKEKLNDKYVDTLHTYLKEHYTGEGPDIPTEQTDTLTVAVYGTFVSEERSAEIENGFKEYLTAANVSIPNLTFVYDGESADIATFMEVVASYDTAHPNAKVDALLGLKTNSAISAAGFSNDGTEYTYSDSEGHEADRRFWYHADSANLANIRHLETYLKAKWTPQEEVENTYFLIGSFNNWNKDALTQQFNLVQEGEYRLSNVEFNAGDEFKVYCVEEDAYYSNDSTWDNCGFTLNSNKNIIVTDAGIYTINFYVEGENNNHVTLEKQEAAKTMFVIGIYDKFVDSDQALEIKQGVVAYFAAHEINADVITTGLGTGNMKSMADAVKTYNENNENDIDAVLGCKITHDDLTAAGYEIGETNYLYGNASTDHDRKIVVATASKTRAEYLAFVDYMDATWSLELEVNYYLIGSFNEWTSSDLTYKMTKVSEGVYKYENMVLTAGAQFKVFTPGDEITYYSNASTWEGCGFTLGDYGNIVVTNAGLYNINFYLNGENNNHVTLELIEETYFTIGFYAKFVVDDNINALTAGITKYFEDHNIEVDHLVFETFGDSGTNVGSLAGLINDYNDEHEGAPVNVILGCKADKDSALSNAGYQQFDGTYYNYGTDAERRLWCQKGATENVYVLAVQAYLAANWAVDA